MSGLSAIKGYKEAGEVDSSEATSSGTSKPTMTGGKGSSYIYTQGAPIDESVLENMQRLVAEKAAGQNSLVNTLKDTLAFFPGDPTLRSQSLGQRAQEREQESADIFNMRQAIAQGRAQQKLDQQAYESDARLLGGGTGTSGGAPSPDATGNPYGLTDLEIKNLMALPKDAREKEIAKLRLQKSKSQLDYQYGVGTELVDFPVGDRIVKMTRDQANQLAKGNPEVLEIIKNLKPAAPAANAPAANAPAANAPAAKTSGPVSKNFSDEEIDRLIGTESSNKPYAINKDTKAMGYGQFLPETLAMLHQQGYRFDPFDRDQTRAAIGKYLDDLVTKTGSREKALGAYGGFITKDPTAYINKVLQPSTGTQTQPNAALMSSTTGKPSLGDVTGAKLNEEQIKSNVANEQALEKSFLEKTDATALADRETAVTDLRNWIDKWGPRSDKIVGLLNEPNFKNGILTLLRDGVNIPGGSVNMASVEEFTQKLIPGTTKDDVEARQDLNRLLGSRILDVVQRSKGSTSDRDWVAFKQIAGSASNSIDLINKLNKLDEATLKRDKADRALYDKNYDPRKGRSYNKHSANEERKKIFKDYNDEVNQITRSTFKPTKAPVAPSGVPKSAKYSPSQKAWFWKDQNGNVQSQKAQ